MSISLLDEIKRDPSKREFLKGRTTGIKLANVFSDFYDRKLKEVLLSETTDEFRNKVALVATGGYGRREIFPASDLDIMFLVKQDDVPENEIKKIAYTLWDNNIDLGYSVRTTDECIALSLKDMKVLTSLLDARFIAGSRALFNLFNQKFVSDAIVKKGHDFTKEMISMRKKRALSFGNSVYMREPDLKEGPGGLRDYHTSLWLLKARFGLKSFRELSGRGQLSQNSLNNFRDSLNVMFDLRHRLHLKAKGKRDILSYSLQREIARDKNINPGREITAEEKLMRKYYEAAENIDAFCDLMVDRSADSASAELRDSAPLKRLSGIFAKRGGTLVVSSGKRFLRNSANIVKAFVFARRFKLTIHDFLKELIAAYIKDRKSIQWDKETMALFAKMFSDGDGLYETLKVMNRLGVLASLIPEFKAVKARMKQDIYHDYTVDAHSLNAVKELSALRRGDYRQDYPFLTNLIRDLRKSDLSVLYLSALLHDLGKGRGKDHSVAGAKIAQKVAARLMLTGQKSKRVVLLVKNHLNMAILSQRRDLEDPVMLNNLLGQINDVTNLKLLYLLTFADLRSVALKGKAFTGWKNMLLRELYDRALELLSMGWYRKWIFGREIMTLKRRMVRDIENKDTKRSFRRFVNSLPEGYFRVNRRDEILKHFSMVKELQGARFVRHVERLEEYGINRLTIVTRDVPGLFSMLTGALSACRINILSSSVFSTDEGLALDVFLTSGDKNTEGREDSKWKDFEQLFELGLTSKDAFSGIVRARLKKRVSILDAEFPSPEPAIKFDNRALKDFSILEVYAEDKIGLLYDISTVLYKSGTSIHFAKISTVGKKAQDVFYLTDLKGRKIKIAKIRQLQSEILKILRT